MNTPRLPPPAPFRLDKKIALVTGAGSGIGASIAETLARAGAFVWVSDVHEVGCRATLDRVRTAGGAGDWLRLDVTSEADATAAERRVHASGRPLDILVNNAGIGHVGTMLQTGGVDLDRLYGVNVRGMFNLVKVFLPGMIERRSGNVINLASIGGMVAVRDRLAYCTTKFAVVGLTKCVALDHARQGIRCNCLCPGRVETPFVAARLREYPDPRKAYEEMASTQALGRMARPEEIAAAALYLASDESAFVTGTAFLIDGGWSAGK